MPEIIRCYNHPDRPAAVNLDWDDDGFDVCPDCIAPAVADLWETLGDMFLGDPIIRIRPIVQEASQLPMPTPYVDVCPPAAVGANPHPAMPGDETETCAGCGHPVSGLDDVASVDHPYQHPELIVWHVACPTPAGLTFDSNGCPVWAAATSQEAYS